MRVEFGHSQLDTEARTLEREGRRVPVEPRVFDLLVYLIEHRDRVASSQELLDALWPGISVGPAALSGAVHKARQVVGDDGERQAVLRTVHGRGFQFVADLSDVPAPKAGAAPAPRPSRARWLAAAGVAALALAAASLWLQRRPAPEALPGHTLAVLPFVNLSPDPDQAYFADGIAEELLNTVAHFDGLRVVGRTSSFSFRGSDADLRAIGEKLGADVILEGSVRTEGDRVRITAQLVDAGDGLQRWSEIYDRDLGDLFAIQTEIATAISTALRVQLSREHHRRLATPPTQNLAAYQAYLLGTQRIAEGTTAGLVEATDSFQRAIELDPKFALAYAGLADAYVEQSWNGVLPPDELLARAQAAADEALELDDGLAEAHRALAVVKWYKKDLEGAEAAFQHALALNPNSVMTYHDYGHLLGVDLGRYDEALALHWKALELDPLSLDVMTHVGEDLQFLGRFEESLAWCERALEIDPDYGYALGLIATHHWFVSGRVDQAVIWMAKLLARDPGDPSGGAFLAHLFLELSDPDRAGYWIHQSIEMGPENLWANAGEHALALYRGDEAAAQRYAQRAFAIWPRYFLTFMRDQEVRAGRYSEARDLYEELFPELLEERDPVVSAKSYRAAIDLALILSRTGEQERADLLLDRSLEQIQRRPRRGRFGFGIADVQIYALQGEKQKALVALRQAIDEGWHAEWWYWLQQKPDLEPLHDEPAFQAMLAEIRADMAAQLEHVREMERRGELVFPAERPGSSPGPSTSLPPAGTGTPRGSQHEQ